MRQSFSGTSAQLAIVMLSGELMSLSAVDLAVDGSANLAIDPLRDVAVKSGITWDGSTASKAIVLSGQASMISSAGAE